jgi:hypothetical protein
MSTLHFRTGLENSLCHSEPAFFAGEESAVGAATSDPSQHLFKLAPTSPRFCLIRQKPAGVAEERALRGWANFMLSFRNGVLRR